MASDEVSGPIPARADQFMSVAAHDLRNPIAVVRASAQMALRQWSRGDQDAAVRRVESIVQQADRLSEMLEIFLDASRVEVNGLKLRPEMMVLADAVNAAAEQAQANVGEARRRALVMEVSRDFVGSWDAPHITRAVRLLLENAYLYGNSESPILVRAGRDDACVSLAVSGGGTGPHEDEISHLFTRFYRGRAAAEVGSAGSGLGLYVARGIARAHGGDVRYAARPSADTFELTLPLTPAPSA